MNQQNKPPANFRQGYEPEIKTPQFSSRGRRRRKNGLKGESSVNHMMSDLESKYSACLDMAPHVVSYREQWPVPLDETVEITDFYGIRHPRKKNSKNKMKDVVMTIDFFITISINSTNYFVARDIKPARELEKERTVALLELKRIYCEIHNIDYAIVTSEEILHDLAENVRFLMRDFSVDDLGVSPQEIGEIVEHLVPKIKRQDQPLNVLTALCDHHFGLELGMSLKIVNHLIINQIWIIDLTRPFDPHLPLVLLADKTSEFEELSNNPSNLT